MVARFGITEPLSAGAQNLCHDFNVWCSCYGALLKESMFIAVALRSSALFAKSCLIGGRLGWLASLVLPNLAITSFLNILHCAFCSGLTINHVVCVLAGEFVHFAFSLYSDFV